MSIKIKKNSPSTLQRMRGCNNKQFIKHGKYTSFPVNKKEAAAHTADGFYIQTHQYNKKIDCIQAEVQNTVQSSEILSK
jgi:hypothetical protein